MSVFTAPKKFAVVSFDNETVEVIPSSWLLNEAESKWPNSDAHTEKMISKYIRKGKPLEKDWERLRVKIYCYAKSFPSANKKANTAMETSNIGTDSSNSDDSSRKRKKKVPSRYLSGSSTDEEKDLVKEVITKKKKFTVPCIPTPKVIASSPPNKENSIIFESGASCSDSNSESLLAPRWKYVKSNKNSLPTKPLNSNYKNGNSTNCSGSNSALISNYKNGNSTNCSGSNSALISNYKNGNSANCSGSNSGTSMVPKKKSNKLNEDVHSQVLLTHILEGVIRLEHGQKKLEKMYHEIHSIISNQQKTDLSQSSLSFVLPEDIKLPFSNDLDLINFNAKLVEDKNFQIHMIRYLQLNCTGKTLSSFLTSILKKLLVKEVAAIYSRLGRKKKKSFEELKEVFNYWFFIIAVASLKFEGAQREEISEKFGRVLASSTDWERPKAKVDVNLSENVNVEIGSMSSTDCECHQTKLIVNLSENSLQFSDSIQNKS